jgi:hypothetical protein
MCGILRAIDTDSIANCTQKFYICSTISSAPANLHQEARAAPLRLESFGQTKARGAERRGITCDGNVMAVLADFSRCDGVMDRIAYVFLAAQSVRATNQ